MLQTGEPHRFENYSKALNRWFDVSAFRIGNPESRKLAILFADISDRKTIEADLRESAARLQFTLDSSQIGDWDLDLTTQPYTASRSLRHDQIFGYESLLPEWNYDIFLSHVHPDDRALVNEKFQETISTGMAWNFECRILHPDQSLHWIWVRSSVYCDAEGIPIRLLGMVIDISDRKRAEVRIKASNDRLVLLSDIANDLLINEDPKAFLTRLFDRVSVHLDLEVYFNYLFEPEHQHLRLNTFGGISEEIANSAVVLELGEGVCGYAVQCRQPAIVENALESDSPLAVPLQSIGIRAYASHPLMVGDRVLGSFGLGTRQRDRFSRDELNLMQDVSNQVSVALERSRLVAELQRRAEALEQANRIKDEFLAVLSHELRTPLNSILGWSRLLLQDKLDSEKTITAIETIERNAKLQSQLIEDLLDISRIMQGKLTLNPVAVSLATVITAAIETVRLSAEAKTIAIAVHFAPNVLQIYGDAGRLQQVVWNLLSKAIKFTRRCIIEG